MATSRIALSNSIWTLISGGAVNGLVTNESQQNVKIRESVALPDAGVTDGHTMYPGKDGFYNWAGITENIYARMLPGVKVGNVDVTPQ